MIVTLRTARIGPLEQVRAFLGGSEPVTFDLDDRDSAYLFVGRGDRWDDADAFTSNARGREFRSGPAPNGDRQAQEADQGALADDQPSGR